MNDLHEKQYRDAFEKRLEGEVDYKGNPLNPNAEEEEDKSCLITIYFQKNHQL